MQEAEAHNGLLRQLRKRTSVISEASDLSKSEHCVTNNRSVTAVQ
jgi:hypothetical protein